MSIVVYFDIFVYTQLFSLQYILKINIVPTSKLHIKNYYLKFLKHFINFQLIKVQYYYQLWFIGRVIAMYKIVSYIGEKFAKLTRVLINSNDSELNFHKKFLPHSSKCKNIFWDFMSYKNELLIYFYGKYYL